MITLIPPSARSIGLFVVGALVLAVAGLTAFGATSYFENRPRAVTVFHGSVAGLAAGAPVTFRGVPVGKVIDIALQINSGTSAALIPVIMEFEPGRITVTGDKGVGVGVLSQSMLAAGLAASLVMQSYITGQLSIELDYHPAAELTRTGIKLGLTEIPEARSGLSAMKDTIARLPLQQLADDAVATLHAIRELITAPEISQILKSAAELTRAGAAVVLVAESQVGGLSKDTRDAAAGAARAAGRVDQLLAELQPKMVSAAAGLDHLLGAEGAERVVADAHAVLAPRSPLLIDSQTLMHNLAAASGALRSFAEQIDRNPNALVVGGSKR